MADSESDDSDGEGGLGNVSRVVMRPPGHSGKAKKGHLCFDASFETVDRPHPNLSNEPSRSSLAHFEPYLWPLVTQKRRGGSATLRSEVLIPVLTLRRLADKWHPIIKHVYGCQKSLYPTYKPDTCNPYHRIWFNFVVDNTKLDQRVMFHIVNISKPRNLYCDGMTPIVKSSSKKKWSRMPPHQVYFYQSPYHDNHYVLTLSFCFDKEEEGYQFAYSYPYSYSKHQAHLENIEQKQLPFFTREILANSLKHLRKFELWLYFPEYTLEIRQLHTYVKDHMCYLNLSGKLVDSPYAHKLMLFISLFLMFRGLNGQVRIGKAAKQPKSSHRNYLKKWLFLSCYLFVPGSYLVVFEVFEAHLRMIDFLISNHPTAEKLRSRVVFKIIPMINPDGVVLGNFRSNWLGSDFERYWNRISPWSHPPLHAAFETISNLNKDKNVELDFVIDLHAHCSLRGIFVHGNTYQNVYRQERHILFPKLLSQNVDGYESEYCVFNRDKQRRNTCRRFFSDLKETINCYSIYASFHGYNHKETQKLIHFDEESYYRVGRNIARSFADYYKYLGVISSPPKKMHRKTNKQSNGRTRSKKIRARMGFSKVRKKTYKRRHLHKPKTNVVQEVTDVEMQSKVDVKKGHIDFSNVMFPPISDQKTIKRKLLPVRQQCIRTSTLEKDCN
ncbi:hypothetical protein ACFE04_021586 [Oxalis oulophora]